MYLYLGKTIACSENEGPILYQVYVYNEGWFSISSSHGAIALKPSSVVHGV